MCRCNAMHAFCCPVPFFVFLPLSPQPFELMCRSPPLQYDPLIATRWLLCLVSSYIVRRYATAHASPSLVILFLCPRCALWSRAFRNCCACAFLVTHWVFWRAPSRDVCFRLLPVRRRAPSARRFVGEILAFPGFRRFLLVGSVVVETVETKVGVLVVWWWVRCGFEQVFICMSKGLEKSGGGYC